MTPPASLSVELAPGVADPDGHEPEDDDGAAHIRWVTEADGSRTGIAGLRLSGLHCAACAGIIEDALRSVDGVSQATVSAAAERATVHWDASRTGLSQLTDAVRRAGYGAVPDGAASARAMRQAEGRQSLWRLFVAWFCMMQVMMLATPSYVAGPGELPDDLRQLLNWGSWVLTLPVVWWSAAPFLKGGWHSLRRRQLGMDVPVALGVLVTFVASTGATFDPGGLFGHEVYFDSLTMFVAFLLAGRYLEMKARHRAAAHLEGALAVLPAVALRLRADGEPERVALARLRVGDVCLVPAGESFPGDGCLVDGPTSVDEALLTGESTPLARGAGDEVVAGSLNIGAPVRVRLERVGADTRHEAIVSLMREALTQRPAWARAADRWAAPFLAVVLLLAASAAAVWSALDPSRALSVAVAVLIVTCPCALSLAAPSALLAAAGGLARRGVLLRRLEALEALAQVRRLYIDKTGTLTEDRLRWSGLDRLADDAPAEPQALALAASLARWSTHPLSRALVEAATDGVAAPAMQAVQEVPGQGLSGRDAAGREWRLGRQTWVAPHSPAGEQADDASLDVWLGAEGRALVRLRFEERLRDDAAVTLQALQAGGIDTLLLSGDAPSRVARVAARLPLHGAVGGATPEAKLAAVRAAQGRGDRVAMVGDGLNDAPVLAQADVSFAMGHGALVARTQADAVVLGGRLEGVADAHRVALRTMRVIRQNLAWAAVYNAACIPLALAGWLPPWAAGLGMATSSLVVVLNALRLAR